MPKGIYIRTQPNFRKGKTYEALYGLDKARDIKQLLSKSHKNQIVWNKGLTKELSDGVARIAASKLGKKRSSEICKKISKSKKVSLIINLEVVN